MIALQQNPGKSPVCLLFCQVYIRSIYMLFGPLTIVYQLRITRISHLL